MKIKVGIGVLLVTLALGACTEKDGVSEDKLAPQSKESRLQEISTMEAELKKNADLSIPFNKAKADALIKRYRDYVNMNSQDSVCASYLFKAADLSVGMGNYEASVNYLNSITSSYTEYEKIVEIWLFKGFVYENYMNNHAMAVEAYEGLIEKYPNHRLAGDARAAIENLTLSEEELMEKFSKMNAKPEG